MKLSSVPISILLTAFCVALADGQPQTKSKAELVGTWTRGYEDYQEFMYHRVERFTFDYLKQNPGSKMIARLCTKKSMAVALVSSYGFAYDFARFGTYFKTPIGRFYLARWAKCPVNSEQYWFVPPNDNIDFDELIEAERVSVRRWITSDYDAATRKAAKKDFEAYLKEFVAEMKTNPNALGFVIRNLRSNNRLFTKTLRQLRLEKLEKGRIQVIRKSIYETYYPEFMAVTIQRPD